MDIRTILACYIGEHTYLRLLRIFADIPADYYREIVYMEIDECDLHIPDSYSDFMRGITSGPDICCVIYCGNRGISRNGFTYIRNKLHGRMNINNAKLYCKIGMDRGRLLYHESLEFNNYIDNYDIYTIHSLNTNNIIRAIYNRMNYIVYKNGELEDIRVFEQNYKYKYSKVCNYYSIKCKIGDVKYNIYKSDYEIYCEINNNSKIEYSFYMEEKIELRCNKSYYDKRLINYIGTYIPLFDTNTLILYRPCGAILGRI
jgi:hypothetical protein